MPQGGETCNANGDAKPFMGCENALRQLDELHFNTLNIGYLQEVLDGWRVGGCMAEVERRLGYRFRLVDSKASAEVAPGGEFRLSFTVANDGFGNLYNQRPLEIVLRPVDGGEELRLATWEDPRRWMTGRNTLVEFAVRIPAETKPGEYQVLLSLPDSSETLRGRPEYAIQLANAEVWEPTRGMNRLAHSVKVE